MADSSGQVGLPSYLSISNACLLPPIVFFDITTLSCSVAANARYKDGGDTIKRIAAQHKSVRKPNERPAQVGCSEERKTKHSLDVGRTEARVLFDGSHAPCYSFPFPSLGASQRRANRSRRRTRRARAEHLLYPQGILARLASCLPSWVVCQHLIFSSAFASLSPFRSRDAPSFLFSRPQVVGGVVIKEPVA